MANLWPVCSESWNLVAVLGDVCVYYYYTTIYYYYTTVLYLVRFVEPEK